VGLFDFIYKLLFYNVYFFLQDNPSDFSYFFDTSRRRCCYIAPERFVESGLKNQEGQGQTIDLTSGDEVKAGDLTPPMDIFSAGLVYTWILGFTICYPLL
jgi:hypothetical protein